MLGPRAAFGLRPQPGRVHSGQRQPDAQRAGHPSLAGQRDGRVVVGEGDQGGALQVAQPRQLGADEVGGELGRALRLEPAQRLGDRRPLPQLALEQPHPRRLAPQLRADPSDELVDLDGLDEVVVRAGLQAPDTVGDLGRAGDEDDRQRPRRRPGADGAQDREAVHARHLAVQQHSRDVVALEQAQRGRPVGRGGHREAGELEGLGVELAEGLVVIDDQDALACAPCIILHVLPPPVSSLSDRTQLVRRRPASSLPERYVLSRFV